jgi:predicted DNA-binding antitoxin AbrB/MazE fold protein
MTHAVEAIYEGGVFRPLSPVPTLADQARVVLTVETKIASNPLARCIGILPDEDAREMMAAINDAFESVS